MGLFAKEKVEDRELEEALGKMTEQLKSAGGGFTFDLKIDNEGWVAICREFKCIVTGGENKNPKEEEIFRSIIDAIKTAFHIPITKLHIKKETELPKIKLITERELQLV